MAIRPQLLLTASAFALVATSALAQSAPPAASTVVPEVIVTAQRRSENIQNVPIAVTSFSAKALDAQHITSTVDIGRVVPNMFSSNNVGQGSANVYYIRGLGQTESFPTFDTQVGTYVDDVFIGRQNANNLALFGVEQIQVLRGPQGTLFGRNSTGGAVLVTLQKPADTFGGSAEIGYGSFGRVSGQASVDLPINDQIKTRTAFFGITDKGYVKDITTGQTLNATHDWGVREAVTIKPAGMSNVEWEVAADYSNNNAANVLNFPGYGGVNGSDRSTFTGFSAAGGALEPYLTGDKAKLGQGVDVQSWGAVSHLKIAFSAGTLDFITGFRGLNQALGVDFPFNVFGPLAPFDQGPTGQFALAQELRSSQYSQEVKWSGDIGERFKYTTGIFFLYETNLDSYGAVGNFGAFYGPPASIPAPLGDEFSRNDTSSEAVYAQGDYKVTQALTLTVGGRFTHDLKTLSVTPNTPAGFGTAQIIAEGYLTHLTADEFTPRIALEYKIDPDLMVFASATKGFQNGGWNGLTFAANTFNNFKPEIVWSYETGFRYRTPDHKLTFNTTLFYEDVKDYQLEADLPTAASFVTTNAASLGAYGAEFEANWRPIEHLTLTGNLGLMSAFYYDPSSAVVTQQVACIATPGSASCASGIVAANGHLAQPSFTPPVTLSALATYDAVFSAFTLTPSLGVQWIARENSSTANETGGVDKARTLLDAGLTFQPNGQPWSVVAECRNCGMQNYAITYLFGHRYYNEPGRWDVKFKYKF